MAFKLKSKSQPKPVASTEAPDLAQRIRET